MYLASAQKYNRLNQLGFFYMQKSAAKLSRMQC